MDEEKKSEASWDEPEQVGPYQLQEQVAQEDSSRWECYRATHQRSGAPAVVYKPTAGDEKGSQRAPCTEGLEVEVSGVCWLRIENRPCPPQTVPHQGHCLLPVAQPRPPVTSLDGGDGSEPR